MAYGPRSTISFFDVRTRHALVYDFNKVVVPCPLQPDRENKAHVRAYNCLWDHGRITRLYHNVAGDE